MRGDDEEMIKLEYRTADKEAIAVFSPPVVAVPGGARSVVAWFRGSVGEG